MQLRRRLRSGFAASLTYTYSKSIDDDAYLGGQGHIDREQRRPGAVGGSVDAVGCGGAELARSAGGALAFQLRSAPTAELQAQYTSGAGTRRRHLAGRLARQGAEGVDGAEQLVLWDRDCRRRRFIHAAVPGTGFTNIIRPDLTGASDLSMRVRRLSHLNAAAFSAPAAGNGEPRAETRLSGQINSR